MARRDKWLEHTCAGFGYSPDCPACSMGEPENQRSPEDGGQSSDWRYCEPEEWDVVGGL